MYPAASFGENDRVLFLDPPEDDPLRELALRLSLGLIVVLGTAEQVGQGRRVFANFENVMFILASAEDIPWRDQFFTQVIDPLHRREASARAEAEAVRVLERDGLETGLLLQ